MYNFLRNIDVATWIPILISIISLLYTIISNYSSDKRLNRAEKNNEEIFEWKKKFDIYKEENRQKDSLIQNLLAEQNTRSSIIPYFNLVLKDNRIKKDKEGLILEIGLMNIGKESATNIQLALKFPDKGSEGYFESEVFLRNSIIFMNT